MTILQNQVDTMDDKVAYLADHWSMVPAEHKLLALAIRDHELAKVAYEAGLRSKHFHKGRKILGNRAAEIFRAIMNDKPVLDEKGYNYLRRVLAATPQLTNETEHVKELSGQIRLQYARAIAATVLDQAIVVTPEMLKPAVEGKVIKFGPNKKARMNTKSHQNADDSTYQMKEKGLYYGKDWISSPFEVLGRARDPNGNGWARYLRWRDPDGREHTCAVSDAKLHGEVSALCGDLAAQGLRISTNSGKRNRFVAYLNYADHGEHITVVDRTGWCQVSNGKVFVLPNLTIGDERVVFDGARNPPYAACGTLEEWKDAVGKLAAGHDRVMFAISASLAAPLMDLVGMEGGGFHWYGRSSIGKSTSTEAAASVWGLGNTHGFVKNWNKTANGLEGAGVLHNDLPLVLDELGVANPYDVDKIVYTLASGVGKGRAAKDGSLRESHRWRTLILSTGEMRVTDKIAETKRRAQAGQEIRMLDIQADAGKGFGAFDHAGPENDAQKLADSIKVAVRTYYGVAGPAFLERLINDGVEKVTKVIHGKIAEFQKSQVNADGQVRRAAAHFTLVAAAGELAIAYGILPWQPGSVLASTFRLFQTWLDGRGGTEPAETRNAIAHVQGLIERYGASRFDPPDEFVDRPAHERYGWVRGQGEEREWWVPPETWKTVFSEGFDPTFVARVLHDRGMLKRGKDGKWSNVDTIQGKRQRVYVLTAKVSSEGE